MLYLISHILCTADINVKISEDKLDKTLYTVEIEVKNFPVKSCIYELPWVLELRSCAYNYIIANEIFDHNSLYLLRRETNNCPIKDHNYYAVSAKISITRSLCKSEGMLFIRFYTDKHKPSYYSFIKLDDLIEDRIGKYRAYMMNEKEEQVFNEKNILDIEECGGHKRFILNTTKNAKNIQPMKSNSDDYPYACIFLALLAILGICISVYFIYKDSTTK